MPSESFLHKYRISMNIKWYRISISFFLLRILNQWKLKIHKYCNLKIHHSNVILDYWYQIFINNWILSKEKKIYTFEIVFFFQVLLLHRNNLETLKGCDRFFPTGLTTLTLNGNDLTDLTDVSFLSGLSTLEQLTLADNPCILQPEDESKQFDYRPYVINWCLGLRVLDGLMVGAKERYY